VNTINDHDRPWWAAVGIAALIAGIVLVTSSCGSWQREAKHGSDERNHCWAYSQLCSDDGTKTTPSGTPLSPDMISVRCERLEQDAALWGYDCSTYLP